MRSFLQHPWRFLSVILISLAIVGPSCLWNPLQAKDKAALVDSLRSELPATIDSLQHIILVQIGIAHYDKDSSLYYLYKSLEIAKIIKTDFALWKSYIRLGKQHLIIGKYPEALLFFDTTYQYVHRLKDPEMVAETARIKGYTHMVLGQNDQAVKLLTKGLELSKQNDLTEYTGKFTYLLAELYRAQYKNEQALEYLGIAQKIFESAGQRENICLCYYSKGSIAIGNSESEENIQKTIDLFNYCIGEHCEGYLGALNTAVSYAVLGSSYAKLGALKKAEDHFYEAIRVAEESRNSSAITYTQKELALYFSHFDNKVEALIKLDTAIAHAQKSNDLLMAQSVLKTKSEILKNLGAYEEALAAMDDFTTMRLKYANEQNLALIEEMNVKYQSLEKEQKINLQQLELARQKSKFNRFLLLGMALGVFLLALLIWYYMRWRNNKLYAKKLEELGEMKTRFFTNISHELRTPLTLMVNPLRNLQKSTDESLGKTALVHAPEINRMVRNGNRLEKLIDQMLQLSKLDEGKLFLQARQQDLASFVAVIVQSFQTAAEKNNIRLEFMSTKEPFLLYFDEDKMEEILYNLLYNAFKFSKPKGHIKVLLNKVKDQAILQVEDNGIGIAAGHLPHLFDRFYQPDNKPNNHQQGMGIGLSIVQELTLLHQGDIRVESEEGKGTTFFLTFPLGKSHLKQEELIEKQMEYTNVSIHRLGDQVFSPFQKTSLHVGNAINEDSNQPILLLVEDNEDLRQYLREQLEDTYRFFEAGNGKEALELAFEYLPDIILCDVMMPEMDGYSFCKAIREDERTNHIPLILLTAKGAKEDILEGLTYGADDYITKPFDQDILFSKIRNLILQRKQLRLSFAERVIVQPKDPKVVSLDEQFINRLLEIIDQHMSDYRFNVDEMSREVGMSRAQLFRKLKAISGQTPTRFIRTIRLKRAYQLLEKSAGSATEIAYQVGFNNPNYFFKCFKEEFGMTPKQVMSSKE